MADQDDASKTEEPTARKLSEARDKGQVAQSQEVSSFAILLAGALGIGMFGAFIAEGILNAIAGFIEKPERVSMEPTMIGAVMVELVLDVSLALSPLIGLVVVLGVLGKMIQNGPMIAGEAVQPQLERVSPLSGFKRLFSMKSVMELVKGIFKIIVVGVVAAFIFIPELERVDALMQMELISVVQETETVILQMMIGVVAVMAVIAIADYVYQRAEFMKQMRMTKQEVKDEHRQSEGDPMVRARLRQLRMERARQRMMAAVPTADVVVTNPTHFAVALKYEVAGLGAPKVVAKGADAVAFRIREVANDNDVPIVENPPLARALFDAVELDQEIPQEHYKAVAEVIGYVYRLKGKSLLD